MPEESRRRRKSCGIGGACPDSVGSDSCSGVAKRISDYIRPRKTGNAGASVIQRCKDRVGMPSLSTNNARDLDTFEELSSDTVRQVRFSGAKREFIRKIDNGAVANVVVGVS